MPDISATPPMRTSEVDGVQPIALDPNSTLISNAETATNPVATQPGAALMGDLQGVVTDALLDDRLTKAGLTVTDPGAREKLRESLYTGLQFTALPITDARFIEHADHMQMDITGIKTQLQGLGQQAIGLQKQGEEAVAKLQKNNEQGRRAAMGAVVTGLISTVVGTVAPFISKGFNKKFPGTAKRSLYSLGIGVGSGVLAGGLVTQLTTGKIVKEQGVILKEGEGLQKQFEGLNQQAMALDASVKEEFLNVHLQRAYNEYNQGQRKQEQTLANATLSHAAQEEGVRAYTPVADAAGTQAAGEEMKAYTPVASAESQPAANMAEPNIAGTPQTEQTKNMASPDSTGSVPSAVMAQTADGSHSAVPYTSAKVDNTLPPGSDAPPPWSTYETKGTGWSTNAETQGSNPAGSLADVGAGGEAPKTSMDAFVNTPPTMEPKSIAAQQKETSQNYNADVSGASGGSLASAADTQAAAKFTDTVKKQGAITQHSADGYASAASDAKAAAGSLSVA